MSVSEVVENLVHPTCLCVKGSKTHTEHTVSTQQTRNQVVIS